MQRRGVDICKNGRLGDEWTDLQVLSPTKKGPLGVHSLNKLLQDALNPKDRAKAEMTYGETLFRVGDKVLQIKNNYKMEWTRPTLSGEPEGCGVFNGDIAPSWPFTSGTSWWKCCLTTAHHFLHL